MLKKLVVEAVLYTLKFLQAYFSALDALISAGLRAVMTVQESDRIRDLYRSFLFFSHSTLYFSCSLPKIFECCCCIITVVRSPLNGSGHQRRRNVLLGNLKFCLHQTFLFEELSQVWAIYCFRVFSAE